MAPPLDQTQTPNLDALLERRLARLDRLAELAMGMAELISEEAHAHPKRAGDLALQFTRVAKAARQTLALQAHFCAPPEAPADIATTRDAGQKNAPAAADHDGQDPYGKQFETEMILGQVFRKEAETRCDPRLELELEERMLDLFEPALFVNDASLAEIIAGICADLGLAPDWAEWTGEEWGATERHVRAALRAGVANPFRPSQIPKPAPPVEPDADPGCSAQADAGPALAEAP